LTPGQSESFASGVPGALDLDLDVDAGGRLDALQTVDRLGGGVDDVPGELAAHAHGSAASDHPSLPPPGSHRNLRRPGDHVLDVSA
jgi:hypothetical protein